MPLLGQLKQATAYTIDVDAATVNGPIAITIIKINRRDNVAAAETHTVAANTRLTITDTAGPRIDRVIVQVHPPRNASFDLNINQVGGSSFPDVCVGDIDYVFNAVP